MKVEDPQQKQAGGKLATSLTSPVHFLTEQQKIFVGEIIKGRAPSMAARIAGYSHPDQQGYSILKSPKVQDAVRFLHKRHEKAAEMTRKKVMDGLIEAIEMAKLQADSGNMIAGWREVGKMCGYYAPEVKKIDINITAKRVVDKLETMTDEDLIKMIEDSSQIIEIEATEVLDAIQKADTDFSEA